MTPLRDLEAPGATRHDWVIDGVLAAGFALVTAGPYLALLLRYAGQGVGSFPLELATALAMVAPLALRRHYPLVMMWLVTVAGLLQVTFLNRPVAAIVVLPFVVYSVARWVPGSSARLVVVIGGIGSILGPVRWFLSASPPSPTLILAALFSSLVCLGLVLTPYAIGRRFRDSARARQSQFDVAAEKYRLMLAERDSEVLVNEERSRNLIARELHDIVAHSLSVMVVQAEGGKALAAKRPEAAAQVLGTIAETGREALGDLRRILGVLRQDPDGRADFAPTPGLDDVAEMVRKAGAEFVQRGRVPAVGPALGLTAYRIVQEALTNVLKHAGPEARAVVTFTYKEGRMCIEVLDDGKGSRAANDGRGFGLRGMAERVAAMGGQLTARPRDGGAGFVVRAELPLEPITGSA